MSARLTKPKVHKNKKQQIGGDACLQEQPTLAYEFIEPLKNACMMYTNIGHRTDTNDGFTMDLTKGIDTTTIKMETY